MCECDCPKCEILSILEQMDPEIAALTLMDVSAHILSRLTDDSFKKYIDSMDFLRRMVLDRVPEGATLQ